MRGGLENMFDPEDFKQHEQRERAARKKATLEDRAREAGL